MKKSQLYIETVINTKLSIENKIVFENIGTNGNSTNIQAYLNEKYETILKDSVEYYFIANLTNDTLLLSKLNNKLVGQDYGKFNDIGYKPTSLFIHPTCGTGIDYSPLKLEPGQILLVKSKTKKSDITQIIEPNCFIKIKTSDKHIISKPFKRNFSKSDFYVNLEDASYLLNLKKQMAFKN